MDDDCQPIACSLSADEVPGRLAAWQAVVAQAAGREPVDGGVRLRFEPADGLAARLAALAEAEQRCCTFFSFSVAVSASGVALEVRAPADAGDLVTALVGAPPTTRG